MSANDNISRLYLTIPASALEPEHTAATATLLDQLTSDLDIACVRLPLKKHETGTGYDGDRQDKELIARLQQKNVAVLADITSSHFVDNRKSFEKSLEQAQKMNFDGLHLSAEPALYDRAREVLGANAVLGIECQGSKHLAMLLGEKGADYVAFGSLEGLELEPIQVEDDAKTLDMVDLVRWWQELFEVPCVASDAADQAQIDVLAQVPADFITLGPTLWPALASDKELLSWLAAKFPVPSLEVS